VEKLSESEGRSGDTVTVETLTEHASDDASRMIAGDPDAEAVFLWTSEHKAGDRRGAGPLDASILSADRHGGALDRPRLQSPGLSRLT
jgi:hypothetical protein